MTIFSQPNAGTQGAELSSSQRGRDVTVQASLDFTRRPQVPYWNTTPLSDDAFLAAMRSAEQQDDLVLSIFRWANSPLSPSQVWQSGVHHGRDWLLTSVRRSITNLADPKCGVLVRLAVTRMGPYGRPEGLWALPVTERAA